MFISVSTDDKGIVVKYIESFEKRDEGGRENVKGTKISRQVKRADTGNLFNNGAENKDIGIDRQN